MKRLLLVTAIALCLLAFGMSTAFAAELDLQMVVGTNNQTTTFGTGSYLATTTVYAGDIYYEGSKLAQFTATSTNTSYPSMNGWVVDYEIIVPLSGFTGLDYLGDFFSVKTTRIYSGPVYPGIITTLDQGIIYAASPALKSLIGLEVQIFGDTMKIYY